jgi:hypothetical protein
MGDQPGAVAGQPGAAAQEAAGLAHAPGVGAGQGEVAALEQAGDLVSVDPVVLGLGAVDEPHVVGVADDGPGPLALAQVGEPVPGERASVADDQVSAVRGDGLEEGVGRGRDVGVLDDPALGVEDAEARPGP